MRIITILFMCVGLWSFLVTRVGGQIGLKDDLCISHMAFVLRGLYIEYGVNGKKKKCKLPSSWLLAVNQKMFTYF